MKHGYNHTLRACFTGYVVQAIASNFAPLLFLTFQSDFGVPLSRITLLITINFSLQLVVDLISVRLIDRIGYRTAAVTAHFCSALGLVLLAVLPGQMSDPFVGLLIAVMVYALGSGLLEVIISPIVEACPTPNKEKAMSLLHSFYCWGCVAVIVLSTLYFKVFGIRSWRYLACLWALVPLVNLFAFTRVPIAPLIAEGESGLSLRTLVRNRTFWLMMGLMVCAGACEQAVSQWASTFAEKGLGVSKAVGDLAGPAAFAVLMGVSRTIFAKFGDRLNLRRYMLFSGLLCLAAYLLIGLTASPVLGLVGCALCGFSVGILWPGTFSTASAAIRGGGTAMFALLALAGDLGCSGGPTLVGLVSGALGDDLRLGILAGIVFPVLLIAGLLSAQRAHKNTEEKAQ